MSILNKESSLEDLINGLDMRGIMVFQVLIGKRCMELLTIEKTKELNPKVILPKGDLNTEDIRKISIATKS